MKQKSAKSSTTAKETSAGFTAEEKAAIRERAREQKTAAGRRTRADEADKESEVLAKIAGMRDSDRVMAERLHTVIKASSPAISPTTWYGMPAYAKNGKIICFFQPAAKFKTRYATLGFNQDARLDEGNMWPVYYALTALTAADEARISALVQQAVS